MIEEPLHESVIWARLVARRVLSCFLSPLAKSHGWHRIYLVSPWISAFGDEGGMSYGQLLKRLFDEDATAYVVSRPPIESWHQTALDQLKATGKANIALLPSLHTKLYCAETDQGAFALLGSANLTEQSLSNREIGIFIRAVGAGKQFVRNLAYEAAEIYRSPDRTLYCQRRFSFGGLNGNNGGLVRPEG